MVKELKYTSIRRVLDNLKDDENMRSLTLEQVVRHTIRFMEKWGYPKFYQDKIEQVEIHQFRGVLPCDLVSIVQVREMPSGICMRSMTDSFPEGMMNHPMPPMPDPMLGYIPPKAPHFGELAFKTQGRIIYTSFPEGMVEIAYKATQVDDDGFPMLIDNEVYLDALEAYITLKFYTAQFRSGKLAAPIFQEIQQAYAIAAKSLETEFSTPSYSEAESMTRYFNSLIPRVREFDKSFKYLGDRQYIRKH
jgi:hypothetical protein